MPLSKIGNRKIIISVSYFCFFLFEVLPDLEIHSLSILYFLHQ